MRLQITTADWRARQLRVRLARLGLGRGSALNQPPQANGTTSRRVGAQAAASFIQLQRKAEPTMADGF